MELKAPSIVCNKKAWHGNFMRGSQLHFRGDICTKNTQ